MEDKRVKQIAMEMFIAWGMICAGFVIIDNIWHVLGVTPMYTCQPTYTGAGAIARAIIRYFVLCSFLVGGIFMYLSGFVYKIDRALFYALADTIFIVSQFVIYWYLGKLFGRFIVWVKHLREKSPKEPAEISDSQKGTL